MRVNVDIFGNDGVLVLIFVRPRVTLRLTTVLESRGVCIQRDRDGEMDRDGQRDRDGDSDRDRDGDRNIDRDRERSVC